MNKKKIVTLISTLTIGTFLLVGCNLAKYDITRLKEHFRGRNAIITTYDEDSQVIDKVEGKSISIDIDDKFNITDEEGHLSKKSSVLNITVGNNQMIHVGSSLILTDEGITNLVEKYDKTFNLKSDEKSKPYLRRIINKYDNITSGKKKIILVRSQTGKPLATYVGNSVSYFATDIPKSTGIVIDDKYLFIYKCDYTIYDMDLIK